MFEPKIMGSFRLAKDPVLRYTANGVAVATIRVAAQQSAGKKVVDGKTEYLHEPIYMNMTAWRKQAENIVQTLHTGDPLFIEGRLYQRHWQDQGKEFETRVTEGIIDRYFPLVKSTVKADAAAPVPADSAALAEGDGTVDDIPIGEEVGEALTV